MCDIIEGMKKIAIGSDHAGFTYKTRLIPHLKEAGYEVYDMGTDSGESVDYPVFAHKVCECVQSGKTDCGILVCGTGIGMSIAANKHKGIRAALCGEVKSAELTRQHNDANVLCMGERIISYEAAESVADVFLKTEFIGGKHARRVAMLSELDDKRGE